MSTDPLSAGKPADDKDKTGVGMLAAVVGGCATIFSFWTSYGYFALGVAIVVCSVLALYQLHRNEPFLVYLHRERPGFLIYSFWLLLVAGIVLAIVGLLTAHSVIDIFRADFGAKPIDKRSYLGAAALWNITPPPGTAADAQAAYGLLGWKRLMNSGVVYDSTNQNQAVRQMLFVESTAFDKSYKSFNAELELPTDVEIVEVYAFLVRDPASRAGHELLESLRADSPIGVDRNKCHIMVQSPDATEKLQVFVVASGKGGKLPPKDFENNVSFRSIK